MGKYSMSHIGEDHVSAEGDHIEIISGGTRPNFCTILISGKHIIESQYGHVKRGATKNPYHRALYGVGYIGYGRYKSKDKGDKLTIKRYKVWQSMMTRCYCNKYHLNFPTYIGCSVDPVWHNFQNFAEWFDENYIDGHQLDKDIKVKGNKVYSPDTCLFVTALENGESARAKSYSLTDPNGIMVEIYNLTRFASENGLSRECLRRVSEGKNGSHKGWTKAR